MARFDASKDKALFGGLSWLVSVGATQVDEAEEILNELELEINVSCFPL